MIRPFPLTPVKELEGLIEALNEATLDPLVRARLAADPVAALAELCIAVPKGIRVVVEHSAGGRARLVLAADGPMPLADEVLDQVVGGTLAPPLAGGTILASFEL
ncbi:MAG: hypothetical protein AB1918_10610 [Pseudomonadota bacterium]